MVRARAATRFRDFIKLQSEYRGRGVRFVGIAAEKPDKVPVFARELGINYTILIGECAAMELARKLGDKAGALPFTVVIDANRKLLHRELGVLKPARCGRFSQVAYSRH